MKNTTNHKGILLVIAMIFIAAFSRLIPHLPNFTAVGAMALFGSAYFSKKYLAILAPIIALWISDLAINNIVYAEYNEGFVWFQSYQLYTFLPIILITILGFVLFKKVSPAKVLTGSIASSLIFFAVSNFGTWLSPFSLFTKDATGLLNTYVAGLPFLRNDFVATVLFSTVLFSSYYLLTKTFPKLSLNKKAYVILS
ncbi:MAG: hypothetical protein ACI8ZX_000277 [Planctomycetota bacterium]|jgi:hypothetical protein